MKKGTIRAQARKNAKQSFKRKMGLGKNKTPMGMKIQKFAASGKGIGA